MNLALKDPLFNSLTDRDRSVLLSNSTLLEFDEEEMFLKNKSLLLSVYYVYEGEIKLRDQNKHLFSILGEGDFIGLDSIYNTNPIYFSAWAVKEAKIIQFEKTTLRKLIATNTIFLSKVFERSGENLNQIARNLLEYRKSRIHGALAAFLLYYSHKKCLNNLTRKDIGEILGYSRENITKVLKNFAEEGYISIKGRNFYVHNEKALEDIRKKG